MLSEISEMMEQETRHVRELKLKEQFCILSVCTYVWLWMAGEGGAICCVNSVNHLQFSKLTPHLSATYANLFKGNSLN